VFDGGWSARQPHLNLVQRTVPGEVTAEHASETAEESLAVERSVNATYRRVAQGLWHVQVDVQLVE